MGSPCKSTRGLGSFTPSCAKREPSPAAIMANFIFLFVIGLLQVQSVAIVAFFEIQLTQWVAVGIFVVLAVVFVIIVTTKSPSDTNGGKATAEVTESADAEEETEAESAAEEKEEASDSEKAAE